MGLFKKYSYGYWPRELGLNLPGVNKIFVDDCPSKGDVKHYVPFPSPNGSLTSESIAHAHMCPLEYFAHSICIPRKYIRDSEGKVSDIMLHEYGHVITTELRNGLIWKHNDKAVVTSVEDSHQITRIEGDFGKLSWPRWVHGEIFLKAMTALGRPDLATPYVRSDYIIKHWPEDEPEWYKTLKI